LYGGVSTWVFEQEQWKGNGAVLPEFTIYVLDFSRYVYAIPTMILLSGIFLIRSRKARPVVFESVVASAWIFAFGWALTAILAWQVARVRIIN
jgi:hypothetical protein